MISNLKYFKLVIIYVLVLKINCNYNFAQQPFLNQNKVFCVYQNSFLFSEFYVNNNNSNDFRDLFNTNNLPIDAIGFSNSDNFIYGIQRGNNNLLQIASNGIIKDIGNIDLNPALEYLAGDISPEGDKYIIVGSTGGIDQELISIDLNNGLVLSKINFNFNTFISDLAFNPYTSDLYGFDLFSNKLTKINSLNGSIQYLDQIDFQNRINSLYFDPFGELFGYGSAVGGIVDGMFSLDKNTGNAKLLSTGPSLGVVDMASCPYSLAFQMNTEPSSLLPCSEFTLSFKIANATKEEFSDIKFKQKILNQWNFTNSLNNTFLKNIDTLSIAKTIQAITSDIKYGIIEFTLKMYVGDVPKGSYGLQAELSGFPDNFGEKIVSDNKIRPAFNDSLDITINRFEFDSYSYEWFLCYGETLILDATEYGNNVKWNTGSYENKLLVQQRGKYTLEVESGCEEVMVNHNVTTATCPYTISLFFDISTDSTFACDSLDYIFILDNDSGELRENLTISFNLPNGFTLDTIEAKKRELNIYYDQTRSEIKLYDIDLESGNDTILVPIVIGKVQPGLYNNRAELSGLPALMGPTRFSYNLINGLYLDSTMLFVIGNLSDTSIIDTFICENNSLTIDANKYANNFTWDNGLNERFRIIYKKGIYSLNIFDGCEKNTIIWNVIEGPKISIFIDSFFTIHQGDSVNLEVELYNEDSLTDIIWKDSIGNTLSCYDCINPYGSPLKTNSYEIYATNGFCNDTQKIKVEVDKSRRLYYPNIISLNGSENQNRYFEIKSPDYGKFLKFSIYDRWGNIIFSQENIDITTLSWDVDNLQKELQVGIYIWVAKIQFIDDDIQTFSGDILVLK